MFSETSHDFGTVARAAKAEYLFELQNIYKEPIHIAGVRASCGCVTPSVTHETLKTWEKGAILVKFNTRSFVGQRNATVTVTIDQPYYAEVQLQIRGYIRGDVVFDPGLVSFGSLDQGEAAQQTVNVQYAGRSDWRITDVRSANTNLVVDVNEVQRAGGRIGYQLQVSLKPDAPSGFFNDEMILVTNDRNLKHIPIRVEGNIVSPLTVSPGSLHLGVLAPGQAVTKNIVVRGKQPFRITGVHCEDNCFEIKPSDDVRTVHVLPVTFTAGSEPGQLAQKIQIETDMGSGAVASCLATVTIREQTAAAEKDLAR